MAKKLKKKQVKKIVNKLVHYVELEDLAEFEEADNGTSEYHRGVAQGLRAAIRLISPNDEPEYAIIMRGNKLEMRRYNADQHDNEQPLALEWVD